MAEEADLSIKGPAGTLKPKGIFQTTKHDHLDEALLALSI